MRGLYGGASPCNLRSPDPTSEFRRAVYAVGLYLDSRGARHALRKFKGQPAAKLASSQAFFSGAPAQSGPEHAWPSGF